MTPEKEFLLVKLNQAAQAEHEEATQKAQARGRSAPPPPVQLEPADIEFPKWLHKGWKETDKAPGHYQAAESKLARTADEVKELLAKGWTEAPPKKDEPKEAAKK